MRITEVEPRGFEPLTSAMQKRTHIFPNLSAACKIAAKAHISCMMLFPSFQVIYLGCYTVAAHRATAVGRPPNRLSEPLTTLAHIARASTKPLALAPTTQTILSLRAFYVGLDVDDGRAIKHVQPPDVDVCALGPEHLQDGHPDRVGPDR